MFTDVFTSIRQNIMISLAGQHHLYAVPFVLLCIVSAFVLSVCSRLCLSSVRMLHSYRTFTHVPFFKALFPITLLAVPIETGGWSLRPLLGVCAVHTSDHPPSFYA